MPPGTPFSRLQPLPQDTVYLGPQDARVPAGRGVDHAMGSFGEGLVGLLGFEPLTLLARQ